MLSEACKGITAGTAIAYGSGDRRHRSLTGDDHLDDPYAAPLDEEL